MSNSSAAYHAGLHNNHEQQSQNCLQLVAFANLLSVSRSSIHSFNLALSNDDAILIYGQTLEQNSAETQHADLLALLKRCHSTHQQTHVAIVKRERIKDDNKEKQENREERRQGKRRKKRKDRGKKEKQRRELTSPKCRYASLLSPDVSEFRFAV